MSAASTSTKIESWSKRLDKAGGPFYEIRIRILGNEIPTLPQALVIEENLKNRARELIKLAKGGSVLTQWTDPEKGESAITEVKAQIESESNKPTTV